MKKVYTYSLYDYSLGLDQSIKSVYKMKSVKADSWACAIHYFGLKSNLVELDLVKYDPETMYYNYISLVNGGAPACEIRRE